MTRETPSSEGESIGLEPLIDLQSDDKAAVLFFLAGRVPVALETLADECRQTLPIESELNQRFEKEVKIDQTGFLRLTDAAYTLVAQAAGPHIEAATESFKTGKSLREDEEYDAAADAFERAFGLARGVWHRLNAAGKEHAKLDDLRRTAARQHDEALKESTKDSLNYLLLQARQHESSGDNIVDRKPVKAADAFQRAKDSFSQAADHATDYNESRLSQKSDRLSTTPLEQRIRRIDEKLQSVRSEQDDGTIQERNGTDEKAGSKCPTDGQRSDQNAQPAGSMGTEAREPGPENGHGDVSIINRLEESASDNSWESIPNNSRLNGQLVVKVEDLVEPRGEKKTDVLRLIDIHGTEFQMDIWKTHDVTHDWTTGNWYALTEARGSVWQTDTGETRKRLSSTRDLGIVDLGSDFGPDTLQKVVDEASRRTSHEEQSRASTKREQSRGSTGSAKSSTTASSPEASDNGAVAKVNEGEEGGEVVEDEDEEGVFDEIISEFDDL